MTAPAKKIGTLEVVGDVRAFFQEILREAFKKCNVVSNPVVSNYLVDVLKHYMFSNNLFNEDEETGKKTRETLAELFLNAAQSPPSKRIELLKRLGDTSLYISGFFGESLQKKLVDIDYYREMGGAAYQSLAQTVREEDFSRVFSDMASRFHVYTDVFSCISEQSVTAEDDSKEVFALYDRYLKTGSERAKLRLIEKGVLVGSFDSSPDDKQ